MIDQSFSEENLRKIYDLEKRKGNDLDVRFQCFFKLGRITKNIKKWNSIYKTLKRQNRSGQVTKSTFDQKVEKLNKYKKRHIDNRELVLDKALLDIANNISQKDFNIPLTRNKPKSSKFIYLTEKSCAESFFALKQLQENLKKTYQVKQDDRRSIVSCLKAVLDNNLPKHLIRTDIQSFYESIPRADLTEKLLNNSLLTFSSKSLLQKVFKSYERYTNGVDGVPRGIGVSAYLAEIYLSDFDKVIKGSSGVIYYARYVDDIVVVTVGGEGVSQKIMGEIKSKIKNLKLELNIEKTIEPMEFTEGKASFDYLGYSFQFKDNSLIVGLSDSKKRKIKRRVDVSINAFLYQAYKSKRKAEKLLTNRIRFLTGNTKLFGLKSGMYVGIYFSNQFMNKMDDLVELDQYLGESIDKLSKTLSAATPIFEVVLDRLATFSFENGFKEKLFTEYAIKSNNTLVVNSSNLRNIVKVWKDV